MSRLGDTIWFILEVLFGVMLYIGISYSNFEIVYISILMIACITGLFTGIDICYDFKPFEKK